MKPLTFVSPARHCLPWKCGAPRPTHEQRHRKCTPRWKPGTFGPAPLKKPSWMLIFAVLGRFFAPRASLAAFAATLRFKAQSSQQEVFFKVNHEVFVRARGLAACVVTSARCFVLLGCFLMYVLTSACRLVRICNTSSWYIFFAARVNICGTGSSLLLCSAVKNGDLSLRSSRSLLYSVAFLFTVVALFVICAPDAGGNWS